VYGTKAPALTEEGFKKGCTQPGKPKLTISKTLDLGNAKIQFAEDRVFITTENPMLQKLIESAAESVDNSMISVSLDC
jgi:hypothetical protein